MGEIVVEFEPVFDGEIVANLIDIRIVSVGDRVILPINAGFIWVDQDAWRARAGGKGGESRGNRCCIGWSCVGRCWGYISRGDISRDSVGRGYISGRSVSGYKVRRRDDGGGCICRNHIRRGSIRR